MTVTAQPSGIRLSDPEVAADSLAVRLGAQSRGRVIAAGAVIGTPRLVHADSAWVVVGDGRASGSAPLRIARGK